MKWRDFSSRARLALVMMLVAILPTVAGIIIGMAVFGETVPTFAYAFPAICLILFFVSLARLRVGLIGGIIWAVINLFAPRIIALQGLKSSLAQALGIPVCLFSIAGTVIGAVITHLCLRAYKEVTPAAA